jgi:hypothetical protein
MQARFCLLCHYDLSWLLQLTADYHMHLLPLWCVECLWLVLLVCVLCFVLLHLQLNGNSSGYDSAKWPFAAQINTQHCCNCRFQSMGRRSHRPTTRSAHQVGRMTDSEISCHFLVTTPPVQICRVTDSGSVLWHSARPPLCGLVPCVCLDLCSMVLAWTR